MLITTQQEFDEDKYTRGGSISGSYRFNRSADVELANENCRLQSRPEPDNYICFKPGLTFISKSLEVAGSTKFQEMETGNLKVDGQLDVEQGIITKKGLFAYESVQGTMGIFTGAVTGLSGTFGTTQSATSHMGVLTALSLNTAEGYVGQMSGENINVTGTVRCNVVDATASIRAADQVTSDRLFSNDCNLTTVRTRRLIVENGQLGQPSAIVQGNLSVYSNLSAAEANFQGTCTAGDFETFGFFRGNQVMVADITTETLEAIGVVTVLELNVGTTMTCPTAEIANLTSGNIVSPAGEIDVLVSENITTEAIEAATVVSASAEIADLVSPAAQIAQLGVVGLEVTGLSILNGVTCTTLQAETSIEAPQIVATALAEVEALRVILNSDFQGLCRMQGQCQFSDTVRFVGPEVICSSMFRFKDAAGERLNCTQGIRCHIIDIEDDCTAGGFTTIGRISCDSLDANALTSELATIEQGLTVNCNNSTAAHINGPLNVSGRVNLTGDRVTCARLDAASLIRTNSIEPMYGQTLAIDGFDSVRIKFNLRVGGRGIFTGPVSAPNIDSSGSFSHCHVCEPEDQVTDWSALTGRLVESTGNCAVRDDAGVLIEDFKQAPGLAYAMTSARIASTSTLGVLLSVEQVVDQSIDHAHGIVLKHPVAEEDGHQMLRVCGAGDCFVWTVRPVSSETKLTSSLLSGLYTKYVNGIEQPEKVVLTCHEDFSFQMILNMPAVTSRIAALELTLQNLLNQH